MPRSQDREFSAQLLRVDLSAEKSMKEGIDSSTLRNYVGGCALGAKLMYEEIPPGITFADPQNRLMILAGPLSGTRIAGSGGVTVCALGAMTGGAASTQAQGSFGAYLRLCGLMGLILKNSERKKIT